MGETLTDFQLILQGRGGRDQAVPVEEHRHSVKIKNPGT